MVIWPLLVTVDSLTLPPLHDPYQE
jgi:hypothetical protein